MDNILLNEVLDIKLVNTFDTKKLRGFLDILTESHNALKLLVDTSYGDDRYLYSKYLSNLIKNKKVVSACIDSRDFSKICLN